MLLLQPSISLTLLCHSNTVELLYSGHLGEYEIDLIKGVSSFQGLASLHYLLITQSVLRKVSGLMRYPHIRQGFIRVWRLYY